MLSIYDKQIICFFLTLPENYTELIRIEVLKL